MSIIDDIFPEEKKYHASLDSMNEAETKWEKLEIEWYRKENGEITIDRAWLDGVEQDTDGISAIIDWEELEKISKLREGINEK